MNNSSDYINYNIIVSITPIINLGVVGSTSPY